MSNEQVFYKLRFGKLLDYPATSVCSKGFSSDMLASSSQANATGAVETKNLYSFKPQKKTFANFF